MKSFLEILMFGEVMNLEVGTEKPAFCAILEILTIFSPFNYGLYYACLSIFRCTAKQPRVELLETAVKKSPGKKKAFWGHFFLKMVRKRLFWRAKSIFRRVVVIDDMKKYKRVFLSSLITYL